MNKVILISGKARHGKDTFAEILEEKGKKVDVKQEYVDLSGIVEKPQKFLTLREAANKYNSCSTDS